jgi:hypothetical protein
MNYATAQPIAQKVFNDKPRPQSSSSSKSKHQRIGSIVTASIDLSCSDASEIVLDDHLLNTSHNESFEQPLKSSIDVNPYRSTELS